MQSFHFREKNIKKVILLFSNSPKMTLVDRYEGAYNKFSDFFRIDTFIDSAHKKL